MRHRALKRAEKIATGVQAFIVVGAASQKTCTVFMVSGLTQPLGSTCFHWRGPMGVADLSLEDWLRSSLAN